MSSNIIHIGYPRTATTWFQKHCFPEVNNYTYIQKKWVLNNIIHPLPDEFAFKVNKIQIPKGNCIISEEMITGRIRGGQVNMFYLSEYLNRLKQLFFNGELVVFIRSQKTMIQSLYNLYVMKGGTYSLRRFLMPKTNLEKHLLFDEAFLDYYRVISFIKKTCPAFNLNIFLYEDFKFNQLHFLQNFSTQLGLEIALEHINLNPLNVSYSRFNITSKRFCNRFHRYGIPFKHYYFHIPKVNKISLKGRLLFNSNNNNNALLNQYVMRYNKSNTLLMEEFGLNQMREYGYLFND